MKKKLVVLSGAGISAESGISTFRDADGLWENHKIEDVATPEAFIKNPQLVLDFYNQRRRQLQNVKPNRAHEILAELEEYFDVNIITQNVDDLHERANSTQVLHLHGELNKARPAKKGGSVLDWHTDLNVGDVDDRGVQLRPHIVWFGEIVAEIETAAKIAAEADLFLIVGTSMNVFPAAGLISELPANCPIFVIDPNLEVGFAKLENCFRTNATLGMELFKNKILEVY